MKLAGGLLIACLCFASEPLKFEVASIKQRPPDSLIVMVGGAPSGSRLTLEAMSLPGLIAWAYNVKQWQVTGGPAWAAQQKERTLLDVAVSRFDIVAKAEGDRARTVAEFREMLQALLAERFHLTFHFEERDSPVYALVQAKGGSKVKESGPDSRGILSMKGRGRIASSGGTMAQLVDFFSNANGVDRPVVDQTGLSGGYDYALEWTNPLAAQSDAGGPSVFTAVTEQLGLKLEPRRAPVRFLVIDKAEVPDRN